MHEYLHDCNDASGHEHSSDFYKEFHDIVSNSLESFSYDAVRCYLSERKKAGFKYRTGELKALDLVTVESIDTSGALAGSTGAADGVATPHTRRDSLALLGSTVPIAASAQKAAAELEAANALGFDTVAQMKDHQVWLNSPQYRAWKVNMTTAFVMHRSTPQ